MRFFVFLGVTLVALAACAQEGPPPVAPVELSVPPLASAAAAGPKGGPAPGIDPTRCTARLSAEPIQTNPGCELDERISKGPGQLLFPCRGDGVVEALFDEHRFEGTVQGGTAVLRLRTELEWHDRCLWETNQELRGPLQRDGTRAQPTTLVWSYGERTIKVGPRGNCDTPCRAKAEISVE